MPFTLYAFPVSQPSRAITWFMKNNGITTVGYNVVNILAGESATPEFQKRSIYQAVPVLELEDGSFLTESGAILNYLATKFQKRAEYPETPEILARIHEAELHHDSLARVVTTQILMPVLMGYVLKVITPAQAAEKIAANAGTVTYAFGLLDKIFATQKYIAGNTFTIADYLVASELNQMPYLEKFLPDNMKLAGFPNVSAYVAKIKAEVPNNDECLKPFTDVITTVNP